MQPLVVALVVSAIHQIQQELFTVLHFMPYYSRCSVDYVSFPYGSVHPGVDFHSFAIVSVSYVTWSPVVLALCSCIRYKWYSDRLNLRKCNRAAVVFVVFIAVVESDEHRLHSFVVRRLVDLMMFLDGL